MKRFLFCIMVLLAISSAFGLVDISKDVADQAVENTDIAAVLTISASSPSVLDLAEMIPKDWEIKTWSVTGYSGADIEYQSYLHTYRGQEYRIGHWKFTEEINSPVTLTYVFTPKTPSNYNMVTLWVYPSEFNSFEKTIQVLPKQSNSPTGYVFYNPNTDLNDNSDSDNTDEQLVDDIASLDNFKTGINNMFGAIDNMLSKQYY